jgi:hypothetical protein
MFIRFEVNRKRYFFLKFWLQILLMIRCGSCLTAVDNKALLFACFLWLESKILIVGELVLNKLMLSLQFVYFCSIGSSSGNLWRWVAKYECFKCIRSLNWWSMAYWWNGNSITLYVIYVLQDKTRLYVIYVLTFMWCMCVPLCDGFSA